MVRLHLNENPFAPPNGVGEFPTNRYPEPTVPALRRAMSRLYGVEPNHLVVTRGADDAIDILVRSFCRAGLDSIAAMAPSFAAYGLFARMQGAGVREVELGDGFTLSPADIVTAVETGPSIKLAFLCSPNNPTGNVIANADVLKIADALPETILVLDEAYIEFADIASLAQEATKRDNLVVLRTLSKAYGLAGARVGCAIANDALIDIVGRALPPFPLPTPSVALALDALNPVRCPLHERRIADIKAERDRLAKNLRDAPAVTRIWPSETNFLLLAVSDPEGVADELIRRSIHVRRRPDFGPDMLRLTVGTPRENALALAAFGLADEPKAARTAELVRSTKETRIAVRVDLDDPSTRDIHTGIAFYDHMLEQVAAHGAFGLTLRGEGDLDVDGHHSIEDVAIALGHALDQALGKRRGIGRYGFMLPMDEAKAQVLIDLSGRPFARFDGAFEAKCIGAYPTEMTAHIFRSLSYSLRVAIHVSVEGDNDHHKTEACFKAFGRALRSAIRLEESSEVPSTKGAL
jgi:histidinol-phosphate aminotransferase/imidazoleglycerol-phosphate dehydratase/histidinol-phosphatase